MSSRARASAPPSPARRARLHRPRFFAFARSRASAPPSRVVARAFAFAFAFDASARVRDAPPFARRVRRVASRRVARETRAIVASRRRDGRTGCACASSVREWGARGEGKQNERVRIDRSIDRSSRTRTRGERRARRGEARTRSSRAKWERRVRWINTRATVRRLGRARGGEIDEGRTRGGGRREGGDGTTRGRVGELGVEPFDDLLIAL